MIKDSTILTLQFIASVFMAADYFFDNTQREKINGLIKNLVLPVQNRIDESIKERVEHTVQQATSIIWAFIIIIIGIVGASIFSNVSIETSQPFGALLSILFFILFGIAIYKMTGVVVEVVVPVALGVVLRVTTTFLINCPKGTVFGIGFLFLLLSFICRFLNIS